MGDWFVWPKPKTSSASPAPANSPAGGTGPGNSRPAGPQVFEAPSSTAPHPDSPEAKLVSWDFVKYVGHRFLLAAEIEAVKNNLDAKAARFRAQIPPGKLRDIFDAQFAELKKMYSFGQPPGSSAPNLPLIAAKLQTTIGWVDPGVSALLDGVDGAEVVPGKKPTLWEFKTEVEKEAFLVSLDALAASVFEVAITDVVSDLVAAKVAGLVEDKLEEWAVRAAKKIADSIRSRSGAPTDDDDNKKSGSGSKGATETHWISVKLLALPDVGSRKKWWAPKTHLEYPNEKFVAEITSGHKEDSLDDSGFIRYNSIPAGSTSWQFANFFGAVEAALIPAKAVPDAKSLSGPSPQKPCCCMLQIKELTFKDGRNVEMDTTGEFPSPQWILDRGETNQWPIAYTRNKKISLAAKFIVTTPACQSESVQIKGTATFGSATLQWTDSVTVNPSDTEVTVSFTSDNPLPNHVGIFEEDNADINWEANTCGQGWKLAGATRNLLYVTLGDPVAGTPNYWTLLDISCRAAAGETTQAGLIPKAFSPLRTRAINRKRDGKELTYWHPPGVSDQEDSAASAAELLASENGIGQCGSWAEFLRDMYRVHGITEAKKILIVRTLEYKKEKIGFLVKHWIFDHPPASDPAAYTHWVPSQCRTGTHLEGQRNPQPPPAFYNHFIVQVSGQYWDPSYGAGPFTDQLTWENAAIDGLFRPTPEPSQIDILAATVTGLTDKVPPKGTRFQTGFDKSLNGAITLLKFFPLNP